MSRMWARRKSGVLAGQNLQRELKGVHESSLHNSLHFCRCLEFFIIKKYPRGQGWMTHIFALLYFA